MRTQKLGEFIEKWHVKKDDWKGSKKLEVLGVSNVDGITVTSHKKSKDLSKYLVIEPNCFAYNPYRINVGSIGLTPEKTYGLVSPAYTVFKVRENRLIPELLLDFMKSFDGLQQINKYARGTVRKALRYDDLCEIKVNFPSYEEQKKIFNKKLLVETKQVELSDEILTQKQLISKFKQAILQEAIQGKLTQEWREQNPNTEPASELLKRIKGEKDQLIKDKKIRKEKPLPPITENEIPFEIPNNWNWCNLDEVSLFKNGKAHEQFVDANGKYVLINSKFVSTNGGKVKYTGNLMMPMFVDEIAIVMSDVPNGRALSRCLIIDENDKYSLNQRIGGIVPINGVYPKYLLYLLDRNNHYLSFNDGKKQTNLKKSQIMTCPIALPPFEEQKAIVEKIETLMQKCNELDLEITKSEQHANMLMQAVLKEAFESKTENTEEYANA